MDELAALRTFRGEVPERDVDAYVAVRRLLRQRRQTRRALRSRRWALVVAVAIVGVVAASSAFGWTSRLLDAVAGKPAPPPVRQAFAVRNEARARQVMPIFRRSRAEDTIVEQTHGVMGINSSVGPVIIWAAPTRGGGVCWIVDIERRRQPDGRPGGAGGCAPTPFRESNALSYAVSRTLVGDGYLTLVHGRAGAEVASVELRFSDGKHRTLNVLEGFFLDELRDGSSPTVLIARDAGGVEVARRRIALGHSVGPAAVPKLIGPERVVIRLETSSGHQLTFSLAPGENGQLCRTWRYRRSQGGPACGPDLRLRVKPDKLLITRFLWNEALDGKPLVALEGVVGEEIARLDLRYIDGTVERVPVTEGFVFFEIPPAHHKDAGFVLIGRDRNDVERDRVVID